MTDSTRKKHSFHLLANTKKYVIFKTTNFRLMVHFSFNNSKIAMSDELLNSRATHALKRFRIKINGELLFAFDRYVRDRGLIE